MGKEILKTGIKRQVGFLYYCGTDNNGCINVCEAKMAHGNKNKKIEKKSKIKLS